MYFFISRYFKYHIEHLSFWDEVTTNNDMNIIASLNEDNCLHPNKNEANQIKSDTASC